MEEPLVDVARKERFDSTRGNSPTSLFSFSLSLFRDCWVVVTGLGVVETTTTDGVASTGIVLLFRDCWVVVTGLGVVETTTDGVASTGIGF